MLKKQKILQKINIKDWSLALKAVFRLFKEMYKINKVSTVMSILVAILAASLGTLTTYLNSQIIDQIINIIQTSNLQTSLYNLILGLFGIRVLSGFLSGLSQHFEINISYSIQSTFVVKYFKKLCDLDSEHYENIKIKNEINKSNEQYIGAPQNVFFETIYLMDLIIPIILNTFILISVQPVLAILSILTTIPKFIANMYYGKKSWGIWNYKGREKQIYYSVQEYFSNAAFKKELKLFNAKEILLTKLTNAWHKFEQEQIQIGKKQNIVTFAADLIANLGMIICTFIIINLAINKQITIGQFSFYIASVAILSSSVSSFLSVVSRNYKYALHLISIYKVLDLTPKVVNGTLSLNPNNPITIQFKNVNFKYPGTQKYILQNFNFTIKPNQHIAIVGENGAGKSTLIKLLLRFYDVTSGEILINGINIKKYDVESWYKAVGSLFQDFNKYFFSAKENISLNESNSKKDLEKVKECAQHSGAHDFIEKWKSKYNQTLSRSFDDGLEPSEGQWQKIALARAYYKNAPILILDEPTSAIDPKAEYEIFEKLFKFTGDKIVVIISHRFSTVRNAHRIIVLDEGKIKEDGTHQELMQIEDGIYKHAFNLQKQGYE